MKIRDKYKKYFLPVFVASMLCNNAEAQKTESIICDTLTQNNLFRENTGLSFEHGIMGNLPGAFVQYNGQQGASSSLMLRGVNTIFLNSSPYISVDGILLKMSKGITPFASGYESSNVSYINPLDVENVGIINQSNLLSSFGGRAGNGILNVNTRKGKMGALHIDLMARVGVQQTSYANISMLNGGEFRSYLYDYMHGMGKSMIELNGMSIFDANHNKYNHNTNWLSQIQDKNRMFQDYQLSLYGGDGETQYMFSIGYTSSDGNVTPTGFDRLSMRINLDYRITSKISISNYLNYTYSSSKFFGMGTDWDVHPLFLSLTKSPFFSQEDYSEAGVALNRLADVDELNKSNPLFLQNNLRNQLTENRVDEVIKANWEINKKNSLHTAFSVTYTGSNEDLNRLSMGIVNDEHRERQNAKRNYSNYFIRWNLWYDHVNKLANNINIETRAGFSLEKEFERMEYGRRINASTDDFESLGYGDLDSIANMNYTHNLLNGYAEAKLNFKNRLYLSGNVYAESSSNFGKANRWTIYGGTELGAILVNKENSNLKVNAGWNRVGNNDVRGAYQHTLYYADQYMGYGSVYLGNIKKDNIKPEITDNYQAGFTTKLGNTLSLGANYYYRYTKGLITRQSLPIEIGLDPQFSNSGDVVNQGIEANFDLALAKTKDFSWNLFGNISTLKNQVKNLKNGDITMSHDRFTSITREGESIGSFFGYKVKGVFQTTADVNLMRADGTQYLAGDFIMEDVNNDGMINAKDMQVIGSPLPDFFGGFGTTLAYKGLSLNALFTYSYGNEVYNLFKQNLSSMSDYSNPVAEAKDRWISEKNPGKGHLPRAVWGDPSGNFNTSDRWVEDGSYLKLKQVSLSYEVPLKNATKLIRGLNFYVNCNNLFTLSGYSGYDPEVFSSWNPMLRGVDTGVTPQARSYILGVKLSI